MKRLILSVLLFTGSFVSASEPALKLDPKASLQGKKSDAVTYDIDFSVVVTPPYHAKTLKIWLALPQSDAAQKIEGSELSTFPMKVVPKIGAESIYGNRF